MYKEDDTFDTSLIQTERERTPSELFSKLEETLSKTAYSCFADHSKWVLIHMNDKQITKAFKQIFII